MSKRITELATLVDEMKREELLMQKTEIGIFCPSCGAEFKVPEEYLGRKATCKKCRMVFVIPVSDEAIPHSDILPVLKKGENEKHCCECGKIILKKAEICPECGVRQGGVSHASVIMPTQQRHYFEPDLTGRVIILVLSLCMPIVGFIIGLICLCSDSEPTKDVGRFGIKVSTIFFLIFFFIYMLLGV